MKNDYNNLLINKVNQLIFIVLSQYKLKQLTKSYGEQIEPEFWHVLNFFLFFLLIVNSG